MTAADSEPVAAELVADQVASVVAYPDAELVRDATAASIAALDPKPIGDDGLAVVIPTGYKLDVVKSSAFEDLPRWRAGRFAFSTVDSFARYTDRYKAPASLLYVRDPYGRSDSMLRQSTTIAEFVLDDHPANGVDHRQHVAELVLKPTAAAGRWGRALDGRLGQEGLLELVVDGAVEIVEPDAASLRELVGDLHAIRNTEVTSVVRTGGTGSIVVADNVKLHAGQGKEVDFPEQITIALAPFAGVSYTITGPLRVKAAVDGQRVKFELAAPWLDDQLARVVSDLAGDLESATGISPLWQP